jgi:hypothetical protein
VLLVNLVCHQKVVEVVLECHQKVVLLQKVVEVKLLQKVVVRLLQKVVVHRQHLRQHLRHLLLRHQVVQSLSFNNKKSFQLKGFFYAAFFGASIIKFKVFSYRN